MVTTRRSGQRQEQQETSQQPTPSNSGSQRRSAGGGRRGSARTSAAAAQQEQRTGKILEAIDEDTAHHEERDQSHDDAKAEGEAQGADLAVTAAAAAAPAQPSPHAPSPAQQAADNAASSSSDDDSDEDEDDGEGEEDIFGESVMGQLADSLRAALQARAGGREASPSPPPDRVRKRDQLGGAEALKWQPEIKVPEQKQPVRVHPGAGADKEKGLAKQLLAPPRVSSRGKGVDGKGDSAGRKWFELPATQITDEVKQELRLLRLRGAYDPKRFYKSFDETKFPKHFQIGTVVDTAQDFYSSRLTKRERGASITQELMSDPAVTAARKKRYAKLQAEATKYQRVKKRKTEQPRVNQKKQRPKH